jgi:hypothetical protein
VISVACQCQWPRSLRHGPTATRLLGLRVRIPPAAWLSVFCECCVLSGRSLCDGPIACPEESYRVWCVWVWSRTSKREALVHRDSQAMTKKGQCCWKGWCVWNFSKTQSIYTVSDIRELQSVYMVRECYCCVHCFIPKFALFCFVKSLHQYGLYTTGLLYFSFFSQSIAAPFLYFDSHWLVLRSHFSQLLWWRNRNFPWTRNLKITKTVSLSRFYVQ